MSGQFYLLVLLFLYWRWFSPWYGKMDKTRHCARCNTTRAREYFVVRSAPKSNMFYDSSDDWEVFVCDSCYDHLGFNRPTPTVSTDRRELLGPEALRLEERIKRYTEALRQVRAELEADRQGKCTCLVRNTSTPETKAIWDGVEKAASRCPEWAKERVNKLAQESRKRMQSRCPVHGGKS